VQPAKRLLTSAIADAAALCSGQPARRSFPTEQETAPYKGVCERPTAHELPRVYTAEESPGGCGQGRPT